MHANINVQVMIHIWMSCKYNQVQDKKPPSLKTGMESLLQSLMAVETTIGDLSYLVKFQKTKDIQHLLYVCVVL